MPPFRILFHLRRKGAGKVNHWGYRPAVYDVTTEILPFDDEAAARARFAELAAERDYNGAAVFDLRLERLADTILGPRWQRVFIYYAVLVLGDGGGASYTTRFFMGYSRRAMRRALTRLAAPTPALETGIWSIHGSCGTTVEAHTFFGASSPKWHSVPKAALRYYDLNADGLMLARTRCDTINSDGSVTENHK